MKYYDEKAVADYLNGFIRHVDFCHYTEIPDTHKIGDFTKLTEDINSRFCDKCSSHRCEDCYIKAVKNLINEDKL